MSGNTCVYCMKAYFISLFISILFRMGDLSESQGKKTWCIYPLPKFTAIHDETCTFLFACVTLPAFWLPAWCVRPGWTNGWILCALCDLTLIYPQAFEHMQFQDRLGVVDLKSAIGTRYPDVFKHILFETGSTTSHRGNDRIISVWICDIDIH